MNDVSEDSVKKGKTIGTTLSSVRTLSSLTLIPYLHLILAPRRFITF
jgi:hypothetical protein